MTASETRTTALAEQIARAALAHGLRIAVAESLTSGSIASALGRAHDAGEWFLGGVVAYTLQTKVRALGVTPGPVVTERCASEMATGVRELLGADIAVAVTGVGGPNPSEGHPSGIVYLAVSAPRGVRIALEHFGGDPAEVVAQTVEAALTLLVKSTPVPPNG